MIQTLVPFYQKRLVLVLMAFLLLSQLAVAAGSGQQSKRYPVTAYGAKGDGQTLNTKAIQKAIDKCAAKGGGVVVIPKGTFVSGSVFLKKNVSLEIKKDGILKGSVNQEDYPQVQTRWEGTERMFTAALLNAENLDGISLTGPGTIDGSGEVWTARARQHREQQQQQNTTPTPGQRLGRPRLISIQKCSNIRIQNLKLLNQAVWGLHILYSENVDVENLLIRAEHNIPSSNGIDIDSSKKVRVSGCDIDVNDDCISIKSGKDEDGLRVNRPSEDIIIESCRFGYGHGGVAMGSETSGGIRNVEVRNCVAEADNWAPIRFKSQPSRGGVVENITFRNIKVNDTRKAVEFNMAWHMVPPIKPPAKVLPVVRNVQLIGITGTASRVGDIRGLPDSPIQGVTFRDCHIVAEKGLLVEHVTNLDTSGLKLEVKQGPEIIHPNTAK
ncbi:glycoside hydrolase family 28 protein [Botryobacter ruber]|uniref:glycoside hydrolase family 28 protein n=1 Tax=Botryobacter ruber TaxID=2171629 RepID=UPI000E0AA164|nr:glycoside hydrolase family 28 protein [Botryobacter ruber]